MGERTTAAGGPWLTVLTATAPAVWGTTYLVTTELLPPGHPLWLGVLRALPAGLVALAVVRRLPRGVWWWRAAVLGTLNFGAFFALLFVAAYRLPGGVAATLGGAQPLLVAGLALALLGTAPRRWQLGWAVAGLAGVALLVLRADAALDAVGVLAGLTGTAAMATGIVLTKRWGRPVGAVTFTAWQLVAGGAILLPLAVVVEGPPPTPTGAALAGYAWLGVVGTLAAYAVWFRGIGRLPVTSVSFLGLVSPTVAAVLGWLALGQAFTPLQLVGFALAMGAVIGAQLAPPRGGWRGWARGRRVAHAPSASPARAGATPGSGAAGAGVVLMV